MPALAGPSLVTDTALRLTAIALLLRPMGPWYVRPLILAAAVLALVLPRALHSPWLWGTIALATATRIAEDWPLADNHIYLLCYWTLAIALSLRAADAAAALSSSSRWLLGLAFVCAVLWKGVLSPDFLDGRFFRVTLLTDPRFGTAAQLVGGLSAEDLKMNRRALAVLPEGAELLDPPKVLEPPRLRAFAAASTWGILALEALIAALMLAPQRDRVALPAHVVLLMFCAVTYAFAPVAGFGWLLLVMGLAQLPSSRPWLAGAYLAVFLVVLFFDEVAWADLVLAITR